MDHPAPTLRSRDSTISRNGGGKPSLSGARGAELILIDAGARHVRVQSWARNGALRSDSVVPSSMDAREILARGCGPDGNEVADLDRVVVTGKLAGAVRERLGGGKEILPAVAFWLAARDLIALPENAGCNGLAMIDLSASGFLVIGVDREGNLKDDLLITNPRCGAGSGINLDRVLQKLAVRHEDVDLLLKDYLGETGRARREAAAVRVDRCGVFSTSATISDKNQGIPLDAALATTLKSEVHKTVRKLPDGFDKVHLTGRIFRWQYARDCAEDLLHAKGVTVVEHDPENTLVLRSLHALIDRVGVESLVQPDPRLAPKSEPEQYPAFADLRRSYEAAGRYRRAPQEPLSPWSPADIAERPLILALDVGSTMAKVVLAEAESGQTLFLNAYSNAGDTIETVKKVFGDLTRLGFERLELRYVGVTGSARYQVQQALLRIYPVLAGRVAVLVENYAHARGSIDFARRHIEWLGQRGIDNVDHDLCVLVDIGGEDTKISTIALKESELFDNAMNTKCSAGTGSLMDTLSAMFGESSVAEAQARAYGAPRSFAINATCAVFLMENAGKLQARGTPRDEILASANWAIVENMARTLWGQLDLPPNAVVLLHGQTMLSDPLPLAVTHRLRSFLGSEVYALIPPHPGHRACMGLVRTLQQASIPGAESIRLGDLLEARFERQVIQCRGAVCGDPMARCNRCALSWQGEDGKKLAFTVGGCTAINELLSRKGAQKTPPSRDAYKEIWEFLDSHHARSENPNRLVIPRSFAVSEWAYFLARVFERFGIPVHVDNVRDVDLSEAQPSFNVDCCAPQMGAVGQYRRLAAEPHGVILAPQIETLPTGGVSSGLTCTTNQGGVAVAMNLAANTHPDARFHLFHFRLDDLDAGALADQFLLRLQPVFRHYGLAPAANELETVVEQALCDHLRLRREAADLAAQLAEEALAEGRQLAIVVGREYILNPGLYDSHIRRLLRDRHMTVIPSYVLDVDLDPEYATVYWRNPHIILTILKAVAERNLHRRLRHPGLREICRRVEENPSGVMLPVVQVSTFSCGPDSIIAHYVAEIMKRRPFLLIQSDAVLKELAHLENRVNTYVKQLEQGLHGKLGLEKEGAFEVRSLDELSLHEPINRDTDVLCLPTMGDNRFVTATLRGAGYTCLENYSDGDYDLEALVKSGRKAAGQAVCAPLAAMYADLQRCVDEFVRRKRDRDPKLAGKRRLVLIDGQGPGPCRQGQYPGLHKLFLQRSDRCRKEDGSCKSLAGGGLIELLTVQEGEGYQGKFEDWLVLRIYQSMILKCILQSLLFQGGAGCRDYEEFQRLMADYRALRNEVCRLLETHTRPGPIEERLSHWAGKLGWASVPLKYILYGLHGSEFVGPLRRFVSSWVDGRRHSEDRLKVLISGEGYMRISQAEQIFQVLLRTLGFGRFSLELSPAMAYLELLLEEAEDASRCKLDLARARRSRLGKAADGAAAIRRETHKLRSAKGYRFLLRHALARPLYKASRLPMPLAVKRAVAASRELLPTFRPSGELAPYVGEALVELRHGVDLVLNVAPSSCMVSSMGEVLTPSIMRADGVRSGRIQTLMSAEGEINDEMLTLAALKAVGPERFYRPSRAAESSAAVRESVSRQAEQRIQESQPRHDRSAPATAR